MGTKSNLFLNATEVITDNDYINDIKNKQNCAFASVTKEDGIIIGTDGITQARNHRAKLSKPTSGTLLKAIECMTELTNLEQVPLSRGCSNQECTNG